MSHTPGPWQVNRLLWTISVDDKLGHCVADLSESDPSERADNARLVAAAPELLEACQEARNTVQTIHNLYSPAGQSGMEKILEKLQKVIAKATGKKENE